MGYGEPTSQRELTEAKAYSRSRIAMERAEARRKAGLPSEREATRRTVAPQQSGEVAAMLHLIWCFADEMNERNWRDKQDYILQQANRLQTVLGFIPSGHH